MVKQISIDLSTEEHAALRAVASDLGCLGSRGAIAGQPSIAELMHEIAAGTLVVRRPKRSRPRGATLTEQIRAAIALDPDVSTADLADRLGCSLSLVSRTRREVQESGEIDADAN